MPGRPKSNPAKFDGQPARGLFLTQDIEAAITPFPGASALWTTSRAQSPVIATAIHDGGAIRPELSSLFALDEAERLREEDPFTAQMINGVPNRIIFHRSRFEIDLNRARDAAVYLRPEQAWGLKVWKDGLPPQELSQSQAIHDEYYTMLRAFLQSVERSHGPFVLLDVHSYNHRRDGPDFATDPRQAPDINIGTFSMDRPRWAHVVDAVIAHFQSVEIGGRRLDVGENVAFEGKGEQTRFIHSEFPQNGCAIAVEFKKIFMDEWTGQPDHKVIAQLRAAVTAVVPLVETLLGQGR